MTKQLSPLDRFLASITPKPYAAAFGTMANVIEGMGISAEDGNNILRALEGTILQIQAKSVMRAQNAAKASETSK